MKLSFILILILLFTACKNESVGLLQESSITHASVTKNANTTKPHGFEWESKCGALERVMHTRDALSGNSYGSIAYYYRPINASKTIIQTTPEVVDSLPLHTLSTTLKASISLANIANFEEKYSAWKKTWDNPDIAIYSDPKKYTQSEKYSDLLQLCKDYGKASWPLFVEKLIDGDMLTINLTLIPQHFSLTLFIIS